MGRLLETFVVAQLRPELAVADSAPRLYLVLHTGPHTFALDDRIAAAPIAALWS